MKKVYCNDDYYLTFSCIECAKKLEDKKAIDASEYQKIKELVLKENNPDEIGAPKKRKKFWKYLFILLGVIVLCMWDWQIVIGGVVFVVFCFVARAIGPYSMAEHVIAEGVRRANDDD